jgi:glucan biosynthesis protein C
MQFAKEDAMSQTSAGATRRIAFLDHVRYLMVLFVVVYHSVAAYCTVAPHWGIHDTQFLAADTIRELLDVFMMPVLFFVAGYFALPSLEKRGIREFLRDKATRLLIPWAVLVLVVTPLVFYDQPDQLVRPFRSYWLWYVGRFQGQLGFLLPTQPNQNIFWFLSLLFIFFVLFALVRVATRRWWGQADLAPRATRHSPFSALALFGLLTFAAYFVGLLLFPDTSWFTLGLVLQFEPTRLALLAGYFALGVYAQSHEWFAQEDRLGSPILWGALSAALAVVYLVVGQRVFADPAGTPHLAVGYLLAFAFVRSFLLLSLLIAFISFGVRYWNRSRGLDRQLASASYNMYLTHIWFVVLPQAALLGWMGSPVLKSAVVLLAASTVSFALSRWVIGRWPRVVVAVLLALFMFCLVVRP